MADGWTYIVERLSRLYQTTSLVQSTPPSPGPRWIPHRAGKYSPSLLIAHIHTHAFIRYVYPSSATVPDVEFAVGDNLYKVNAADFALGDPGSDGMVFGGIQSRGSNPFDILGDGA